MLKGALTPSAWQCEISLGNGNGFSLPEANEDIRWNSDEFQAAGFQRPSCIQAPYHIPTLHAFSRFSIFFILNRKVPIDTVIKIQAAETTEEIVTVILPLETVEKKTATLHSLAAKAVMNDFESEQSWLHSDKYTRFRQSNPASFEEIVRQEAENIGTQWSITGKWTSFVAVDQENQLGNLISQYRAEPNDFSDMIKPMYPQRYNTDLEYWIHRYHFHGSYFHRHHFHRHRFHRHHFHRHHHRIHAKILQEHGVLLFHIILINLI